MPERELYRISVKDALAAKVPFVVTFATPAYCRAAPAARSSTSSAQCANGNPLQCSFIHVEVYQDNDPAKGENQWFKEWHLPSEPWTFLVGPDGKIRERFEGTVSVNELDAAVKNTFSRSSKWLRSGPEPCGKEADGRCAGDDGVARGAPR